MKKKLILAAIMVLCITTVKAQDKDFSDGFKIGANFGLPISTVADFTSFNAGADIAYLFEVVENLEIGGLVGYTHFFADGDYSSSEIGDNGFFIVIDYKDASFVPVSSSVRYYFGNRHFFGGADLGFAINVGGDEGIDSGFYFRPKFGFSFGVFSLILSYQSISGGVDYSSYSTSGVDLVSLSGFNSMNIGFELDF